MGLIAYGLLGRRPAPSATTIPASSDPPSKDDAKPEQDELARVFRRIDADGDGRLSFALGTPLAARSDPSTGNSAHASLLLRSGSLAFLFTAPYAHGADAATASLPSFSAPAARCFAADHGLAVLAVALRVADAEDAFRASVAADARPAFEPAELGRGFRLAEVELYGDVVLRFVSYPDATDAPFLPGFEDVSSHGRAFAAAGKIKKKLAAAATVLDPLRFFHAASPAAYAWTQAAQSLGFMGYLVLQMVDLVAVFSGAASPEEDGNGDATKALGLAQVVVGLARHVQPPAQPF